MYKLVLYGLMLLSLIAIVFGFLGLVNFSGFQLFISLIVLLNVCYGTNWIIGKAWKIPQNIESSAITALILFFLIEPSLSIKGISILVLGGIVAMISKYVFALHKRHIFNPAAISVFILGILGSGSVIWWVATPWLFIPTLILGLLVVRKIRRFRMVLSFIAISLLAFIFIYPRPEGIDTLSFIGEIFLSWPLVFFATIMFTEPLTAPTTKNTQFVYAVLIGILFASQFHVGPIFSTPEFALVVGNIYAYLVSSRQRLILKLKSKKQISPTVFHFEFESSERLKFAPGQYLEWTLPHENPDMRGNRRYFTIASSPTEEAVQLGVRIDPSRSSTFKQKLQTLKENDTLTAGTLSGEFLLPKDQSKKIVWIAGGIGITPFRSMIRFLIDTEDKRDIVLFYSSNTDLDFAYRELFTEAQDTIGLKTIYLATHPTSEWKGRTGFITKEMIQAEVPDYIERHYYLSGPHAMVESYKKLLISLHIKRAHIHTDYFPGF